MAPRSPTPSAPAAATLGDYHRRMTRVVDFIRDNLDDELSSDDLSRLAHFSKFHFQRIFLAMLGETAGGFVRRLRLERAAAALRESDRPIVRIAFDAGYAAHEAFTRAFRDHFGLSPAAYRDSSPPPSLPDCPSRIHFGAGRCTPVFLIQPELAMIQHVEVQSVSARRVAALAHSGPYHEIGPTFARLGEWAFRTGAFAPGRAMIAIYYDNPRATEPAKLRSDACIEADAHFAGDAAAGIAVKTLAAGRYAVGLHKGPYQKLEESYTWLCGQWMPQHGHEPADGPCYEIYLNNPRTTPPDELLTAIHIPIRD